MIDLVLIPHPLRPGEARAQLPGPMRLDALMREAWAGRLGCVPVSVWVDGEPAAADDWRRIEVADGAAVTIRPALAGGDTNPLRVVLQLALAVGTAGLLGSGWYAAAGWLARGAAVGGLLVGGNLLVNAVAPPRLPELAGGPKAEPLYALSGGSNRARPWEPLLMVLGERRVFPDLAAAEYTEFRGGQMHLSQLFSFGVGDLEIDDLRLGDTPLADYEEVETELLAPGAGPTLVWSNVDTAAGAELDDAQPVVRRSGAGAARLAVDFVGQIFGVDKKGRYKARAAAVRVDIAEVGGSGSASETVTLRGDGPGAVRVTVELDLPGQGAQWDVTVRRLAAPSQDERVRDAVTWTALRTYQAAAGDASSSTRLAVRVRATGQLNGRLDRLSAAVRCKAPVWRAGAWTADAEATSNPAALARLFALGVWHGGELAGGAGLAPERVDDERLGEWFEFCAGEGFRCDLAAQGRQSRAQLLRSILQCGRADASWATGKFGAVWEDEADEVAGMITPGNVVAGSMQVDWAGAGQLAQEFVGRYTDAASGWREAEVRRLMPGVSSPTRAAEVALHGVTRAEHAAREVNMLASAQLHRRRAIKWRMSLEGLAAARGSRWWIAHSLVDGGETGRLAGGDESNLALDRSIEVGSGSWLAVRLPDGRLHASRISTAPGKTAAVELADPLPASPSDGGSEFEDSLWRHYDSADPPAPVRITGVRPGADHTVEITAVDDPPEYYAADTADLSASLLPRLRPPPAVVAGAVTEAVRRTGLGYSVTLSIALEVSGDWRGGTVLAAADGGDTRQVASMADGETSASWPAPAKGSVEITVVPGSAAAPAGSPWTTTHEILGLSVRPGAPANLAAAGTAAGRIYSWTPSADEDAVGYRLRAAPAADALAYADMDALHEGLLTASPWVSAAPGAGTWDFGMAAVAASGLESAPAYLRGAALKAPEALKGIKNINRDEATGIITVTYSDGAVQMFAIPDGAPGGTSEWIYRSTDDEDDPAATPSVPPTDAADRLKPDFVPAGWHDDPVEGEYTWVSKRTRETGSEPFGEFSTATRWRGETGAAAIQILGERSIIHRSVDGGTNWRNNVGTGRSGSFTASVSFRSRADWSSPLAGATYRTIRTGENVSMSVLRKGGAVTVAVGGDGTPFAWLEATHDDSGLVARVTVQTIVTGEAPSASAASTFELVGSIGKAGIATYALVAGRRYTVPEGGAFTVRLRPYRKTGPAAPLPRSVTVTATESHGDITIGAPSHTFTAENASTAAEFVFRAAEDTGGVAAENATITFVSSDTDVIESYTLLVAIVDNDYIDLQDDSLEVAVGGTVDILARLRAEPVHSNVTLTATSSDREISITDPSDGRRLFTVGNWSKYQRWTVRGDEAGTADVALRGSVSTSGDSAARAERTVEITVKPAGTTIASTFEIELEKTALAVNEGATEVARARLRRTAGSGAPSGNVVITATESDDDVSVSDPSDGRRTYTPTSWNDWQAWTIRAEHDQDTSEDSATVTFSAAGGGVSDTAQLSVSIADDDVPLAAAQAPTSLSIDAVASGREGTTAQLGATFAGGAYDRLDYSWSVSSGTLSSSSASRPVWTRPDVSSSTSVTLRLTVTARGAGTKARAGTSDARSATRSATVTDTTTAVAPAFEIELDKTTLAVNEGGTGTVRARLKRTRGAGNPSSATEISASESSSAISIEPAKRTYSTSDWGTYQSWTVKAAGDNDTDNETAQVTFSAGGGVVDTASLAVTVADTTPRLSPITRPRTTQRSSSTSMRKVSGSPRSPASLTDQLSMARFSRSTRSSTGKVSPAPSRLLRSPRTDRARSTTTSPPACPPAAATRPECERWRRTATCQADGRPGFQCRQAHKTA